MLMLECRMEYLANERAELKAKLEQKARQLVGHLFDDESIGIFEYWKLEREISKMEEQLEELDCELETLIDESVKLLSKELGLL